MRNSIPFLLVVFACGAAIGLGGGMVISGRGGPNDDQLLPAAPSDSAQQPAPGAAPSPAPAGTGETAGAKPAADDSDALMKALLAVNTPKFEGGAGRITGKVATATGKPVQGVLMRATRADGSSGRTKRSYDGSPPEDQDLEMQVRDLVRRHRMDNATRQEVSTDEKGAFSLGGLGDCEYWVSAFKKGFEIQQKSRSRKGTWKPGEVVEFIAAAIIEIRVDVLRPDGSRAEKADIEIKHKAVRDSWSGGSETAWSRENPCIYLRPGAYVFIAECEDLGGLRSAEQEVNVDEGAAPPEVTLTLKEPIGIKGRIVAPEGMDLKNIWMKYMAVSSSDTPDLKILVMQGKFLQMMSEGDLTFTVKDLVPGTYLVGVLLASQRVIAHCTVQVVDRMAEAVLTVQPFKPEEYVIVRVFDPAGNQMTDVNFETGLFSHGHGFTTGASSIAQKDGSFLVLNYKHWDESMMNQQEKATRYLLKAACPKYGSKQVEYDPAATRELTLKFQNPATLEVTVAGYRDSEFVGKLQVQIKQKKAKEEEEEAVDVGSRFGDMQEGLDAEGKLTVGPVEPGEYEIDLMLNTGESWGGRIPIRKTPVTLSTGANTATLRIPPLYQLTVTFEKAVKGEHIMLGPASEKRRWGGWGVQKQMSEDGKVVFEKLPEGTYKIQKWTGADAGSMEITLPGQSSVAFKPKPVNALRVVVSDSAGVLGRAGLQTGDLIIGLDGTEFKNMAHMQMLLYTSMGKEKASLMLLRGGARKDVDIETAKLFNPGGEDQLGGDIQETSRE